MLTPIQFYNFLVVTSMKKKFIQEDIIGTALNATHHNLDVNAIIKAALSNYDVEMVSDSKQSYVTQIVSSATASKPKLCSVN